MFYRNTGGVAALRYRVWRVARASIAITCTLAAALATPAAATKQEVPEPDKPTAVAVAQPAISSWWTISVPGDCRSTTDSQFCLSGTVRDPFLDTLPEMPAMANPIIYGPDTNSYHGHFGQVAARDLLAPTQWFVGIANQEARRAIYLDRGATGDVQDVSLCFNNEAVLEIEYQLYASPPQQLALDGPCGLVELDSNDFGTESGASRLLTVRVKFGSIGPGGQRSYELSTALVPIAIPVAAAYADGEARASIPPNPHRPSPGSTITLYSTGLGGAAFDRLVVLSSGFDPKHPFDRSQNRTAAEYLGPSTALSNAIEHSGLDVAVVNFDDGGRSLWHNAEVLRVATAYLDQLRPDGAASLRVGGPSMGAVVARIALLNFGGLGTLDVSHYFSLDGPHRGAVIDIELQEYIEDNDDVDPPAGLTSQAAKQMLVQNVFGHASTDFQQKLNGLGWFPDDVMTTATAFSSPNTPQTTGRWMYIQVDSRNPCCTPGSRPFDVQPGDLHLAAGSILPVATTALRGKVGTVAFDVGYQAYRADENNTGDDEQYHLNTHPTFIPHTSAIAGGGAVTSPFDHVVWTDRPLPHDELPSDDAFSQALFAGLGMLDRPAPTVTGTTVTVPNETDRYTVTKPVWSNVVKWEVRRCAATCHQLTGPVLGEGSVYQSTNNVEFALPSNGSYRLFVHAGHPGRLSGVNEHLDITVTDTPTVPSAPSGLEPELTDRGWVRLSWDRPIDDGGRIDVYQISHRERGTTQWTYLNASSTATVLNLPGGATYQFRVRAKNSAGSSPWSNTVEITVTDPRSECSAEPTTAVQDLVILTEPFGITWRPHECASGAGGSYLIKWRRAGGSWQYRGVTPPTNSVPRFIVDDPQPATTYEFAVQARNAHGSGPWSSVISGTAGASEGGCEGAPQRAPNITSLSAGTLHWEQVDCATHYLIASRKAGQSGFTYTNTQVDVTSFAVPSGTTEAKVQARNDDGNGPWSPLRAGNT